jgi:hypothetical protein
MKVSVVENTFSLTKKFSTTCHYNYVATDFFSNFRLKLWQLLIKSTHFLYWYIIERIFNSVVVCQIFLTSKLL